MSLNPHECNEIFNKVKECTKYTSTFRHIYIPDMPILFYLFLESYFSDKYLLSFYLISSSNIKFSLLQQRG